MNPIIILIESATAAVAKKVHARFGLRRQSAAATALFEKRSTGFESSSRFARSKAVSRFACPRSPKYAHRSGFTLLFALAVAALPLTAAAAPVPAPLLVDQAVFTNDVATGHGYGNAVAVHGNTAVVGVEGGDPYASVHVFERTGASWKRLGRLSDSRALFADGFGYSVAVNGDTIAVGDPQQNNWTGAAYLYTRIGGPGLNAWNIFDNNGAATGPSYRVSLVATQHTALLSNNWRYCATARMVRSLGGGVCMYFSYGNNTNRFLFFLLHNGNGDLVAELPGASPVQHVLTTNGAGADDFHLHELEFNPATRRATYRFDGRAITNWPGQALAGADGVRWGAGSTPGMGSINVHQVRFEMTNPGTVLASYDAGTPANPPANIDPLAQGWSPLVAPGAANTSRGPLTPDAATLWTEQARVTAFDGDFFEQFGNSIAIGGDTLVVGAPYHNSEQGAAYVFVRQGTNWTMQKKLTAAPVVNPDTWATRFGESVAIEGDTIVVGRPSTFSEVPPPGEAFVFVRTGTNWTLQGVLTAPDNEENNGFGHAVALSGNRIAVGAPGSSQGGASGAVYVSGRSGGTWSAPVRLLPSPLSAGEAFGDSVAIGDDTVVVGGRNRAASYLFVPYGANWVQTVRRVYSGGANLNVRDVAIDGETIVVGVPGPAGGPGLTSGAIYVQVPDYANPGTVANFANQLLYYPSATATGPLARNLAAFRYKHLLYGQDAGRVRARFGLMSSLYGANERQRAIEAEEVLLRGLSLNPASASLGGLLLDVYYDRAVAESIFAKLALEDAGRARFGRGISPPSPTGFLIDNELPKYRGVLETNGIALQGYFDLLQRQLVALQPGSSNNRWAARVLGFSSQWTNSGPVYWYAVQALGLPDTYPAHGDLDTAWASATGDAQREFLELGYDDAAPINSVSIYETWNPGAVDRISVRNPNTGFWQEVWSGAAAPAGDTSRIFSVTFPLTAFPVDAIRIDINSPAVPSWNEIDAVSVSGPFALNPTFGHGLFQQLVPGRGLMPATYTNAGGTSVVTTNTPALTNGMLFTGYKDLVLLFDLLRDYGRTAATLARLHIGHGSAADLAEARRLVSESQRFALLQGNLLLGVFPGLDPAAVDPQSGLAPAIAGWRQSLTDLAAVQQILTGDANVLGFAPDFLMLLENFTAGGGPVVFDSFDSFQDILDPLSSFSELGAALDALALADATYGAYNGYEDQLASEFGDITDAAVDRLFQIVGREPGQPGYETPQTNVGSEIWQQLQSIEVARVRIQKNRAEISNLNKEVAIERNRAASQAAVVVRYANKQASLTEEIGRINAAQAGADQLTEYFNPENLLSGASIAIALNFGVQTTAELEKGEREAEKERLAGLEQAEIIGIDSAALVKTLLLRMNILALDSKEAALLLNQELGRLVALYNEQANLERRIAESGQELASRYFADPLHQLRSQHDLLQAGIRFDEAQKWLFFMARALDYKWNFPLTNYPHGGRVWSAGTLFKLRNADELLAFYQAMNSFDFFANRGSAPRQDVFSVREHFLGYRTLDDQGQPAVYVDPITGLSLDAVGAFRTNLLRRPITQGQIQIEFSTARQLPNRPFFAGPVFNEDGSVFSKGLTLNKINFMKLRAVGPVAQPVSGRLRYGGTSFIRNIFVGQLDPATPNRIANEMTAYSTRSWFYNLARNVWQFRDAYEIENVEVEFNPNPFDLNNPPASNLIIEFKERSVATTGWVLSIPVAPLRIQQLDDLQIYFDYVVSQRDELQ